MQNNTSVVYGIIGGLVVYGLFLAAIIALSLRWSRNLLANKAAPFTQGLAGAGGALVREGTGGGLYTGREDEYAVGGTRVFLSTHYVSRSLIRNNLRVDAGPFPYVTLYPEGAFERFGKAISLNREVQLGDESFDKSVYVDSTEKSDERVRDLLASRGLRDAVRELLAMGYKVQFSRKGVTAYRIDSVYASGTGADANVAQVVALLGRVVTEAPRFDASTLAPEPMPQRRAFVLVGASLFTGLVVAMGAIGAGGSALDSAGGATAFLVGAALWGSFVLALVMAVRGRSDALQIVVTGAVIGVIALPLLGGFGLLALNRLLDGSPAETHTATVLRMHHKEHDLHVTSWRAGHDEERLYTTHTFYEQLHPGDRVVVRVHPGRFGWVWAERVDTLAPPAVP